MSHSLRFASCLTFLVVMGPMAFADRPNGLTEPLWPHRAPASTGQAEGDVPQLIITRSQAVVNRRPRVRFAGASLLAARKPASVFSRSID